MLAAYSGSPPQCSTFSSISRKHSSALNTHSDDFLRRHSECVTSRKGNKIASEVAVRGDSGVAGEERVVSVPKFHSWGKHTMPLTSIN